THNTLNHTPTLHDALPIFGSLEKIINAQSIETINALRTKKPILSNGCSVSYFSTGDKIGHHIKHARINSPTVIITCFMWWPILRSEEHTSELQSRFDLVCR